MDLYNSASYELAERLTKRYSTSFSSSSSLFSDHIRPHIYAIYGMVRIADEIVDTYRGEDKGSYLDAFESEVNAAINSQYSTNPIVHAFARTAKTYSITGQLLAPFFESMRADINPKKFTQQSYEAYIYGSAEVVGLMCLRVFVDGNDSAFDRLREGASALGAAYQKVNFLRDMKADYEELGRVYFPNVEYDSFSETQKAAIIKDIENDFSRAKPAVGLLPKDARHAVAMSYDYYDELLTKLKHATVEEIKTKRMRVNNFKKAQIYFGALIRG